jgi:2-keto-4-pentenoate hydratase/2-oxohepta-3-ene-1,7-dioic acid hydratase in catechol pathway
MKIVRFTAGNCVHSGALHKDVIHPLIDDGLREDPEAPRFRLDSVRLLPPCQPTKIVALGINYRSHATEFKHELPESPLIFLKPSTAVIGPGDDIIYPVASKQVDFEGELGIIIGRTARNVKAAEAASYIMGYTCFNDVTARDLQRKDGQWTRAKGFDTFAPIGPWTETEIDPSDLEIETYLNGKLKQKATTADLIFKIPEILRFVSSVMTLLPGDLIATGTPSGVGPVLPGDEVEVRIQGIGSLINRVEVKARSSV